MFIERKFYLSKIADFINNVQPFLNDHKRADEVYKNNEVIGWTIVNLPTR